MTHCHVTCNNCLTRYEIEDLESASNKAKGIAEYWGVMQYKNITFMLSLLYHIIFITKYILIFIPIFNISDHLRLVKRKFLLYLFIFLRIYIIFYVKRKTMRGSMSSSTVTTPLKLTQMRAEEILV